jgi:PiT family inorganic phosphate transporter
MSEVADSGLAVKVPRKAPPTRRQRAIEREEARLKAEAKAREKAERKKADAESKARAKAGNTAAKKGPQR